jgi:hypothetical protein
MNENKNKKINNILYLFSLKLIKKLNNSDSMNTFHSQKIMKKISSQKTKQSK